MVVRGRADRHLGRDLEGGRVAAGHRECRKESVTLHAEVVEVGRTAQGDDRGQQPAVGDGRGQGDPAWPLSAEPKRRTARGARRRLVRGLLEGIEGVGSGHARWRRRLRRPERPQDVHCGLEAVEALRHRRHRDPERQMLSFVPAGAEPDDEATAGGVVQDRGGLGQHGRVAERRRQHAVPDPLAWHPMDERRHRGQRLEARSVPLVGDVRQVVVHPDRVEHLVLADPRPRAVERRPVDRLGRGLDPDRDAAHQRSPARRAQRPDVRLAVIRGPVVTAPCDAEPTRAAYFARTPPA